MENDILRLYKSIRARNKPESTLGKARFALGKARREFGENKKAYDDRWPWQRGANNVTRQEKKHPSNNYAWIENTESAGLRFVGYADEICKSIRHCGWYTDEDGDRETYRGAVWQLPARHGVARYIAGYEDPNNKGAAFVDLNIIRGRKGGTRYGADDAMTEAAHRADSIAKHNAEREREYNAAWQAALLRLRDFHFDGDTRRISRL